MALFARRIDNDFQLAMLQPSFAPIFHKMVTEQEQYLSQWLQFPRECRSEKAFSEFIQRTLVGYAHGKSMICAIIYHNELVGMCGFNAINWETKATQIGYWLSEKYQGNGIVTRAMKEMTRIAFEDFGLHKVELRIAEDNKQSRAIAERLGMKLEGIISNAERVGEDIHSHAIYAAHRTDQFH